MQDTKKETNKIKTARMGAGITLRELSVETKIPFASLCELENGKSNPTLKTLCRVCDSLGLKIIIIND